MKYKKFALLLSLGLGSALSAHAAPLSFTFMLCDLPSEQVQEEVDSLIKELKRVRKTSTRSSRHRKHVEWHFKDTSRRFAQLVGTNQCSQERTEELARALQKLELAL